MCLSKMNYLGASNIILLKRVIFTFFLLLTPQLIVGQERYGINIVGAKMGYGKLLSLSRPHGLDKIRHKYIDFLPALSPRLDFVEYKDFLPRIDLGKNVDLSGYITTEQFSFGMIGSPRIYGWGNISFSTSPHFSTRLSGLYQSYQNNMYGYSLTGSIRYEKQRWILEGNIRYDQTNILGKETHQGVSLHPSLEYAINDKFSIYSCLHIAYLHKEGSTYFSNTSLIRYNLSRNISFFIGTETYFNPITKRVVVNPTAGIESRVR